MNRCNRWMSLLLFLVLAIYSGHTQELKVTLLGTGTPRPMIERFGMSTLVQAGGETLLFDAGRGCTIRLAQTGVPLKEVTKLFLTHLHSDHTVGIPDLWLTGWIFDRAGPLEVFGPIGTKEMAAGLERAYAYDVRVRSNQFPRVGAEIVAHEIQEGTVYEKNGVKVTAFLVDHGAVKPAFGYRVDYGGHSVVLSGDTRPSENLVKHAHATPSRPTPGRAATPTPPTSGCVGDPGAGDPGGADVLVHEVYAVTAEELKENPKEKDIVAYHTTPEQAGEIFSRVRPRLAVYSHIGRGKVSAEELIRRTRTTYKGPLEVGEDLMVIDIGEKVTLKSPGKEGHGGR